MKVSIKTFLVLSLMVTLGLVVFLSGCGGSSGGKNNSAKPLHPTNLTATAGNGQVSLSWSASSGTTSYNVYDSTTSGGPYTKVGTTSNTNSTVTGLTNGVTYYFVVTAVNSAGESGYSNQISATPSASLLPPIAPTNLTATAGNGEILLRWNASTNAAIYNVYESTSSNGFFTKIGSTQSTFAVINSNITNGVTYYFVVTAVNSAGESGYSNQASATPSASAPPLPPTNLSAIAGNSEVELNWTGGTNVTSYNIYYSITSGGPYTKVTTTTNTNYIVSELANGVTYYFVVTAINSNGESGYSNQASATPSASVPPLPPTNLTAVVGDAQVSLSWSASTNATSYNVYDSTISGGPYTKVGTTTNINYTVTGLTNGVTYYFVVTSVNGSLESVYSNETSATPFTPTAAVTLTPSSGSLSAVNLNSMFTENLAVSLGNTAASIDPASISISISPSFNFTTKQGFNMGAFAGYLDIIPSGFLSAGTTYSVTTSFNATVNGNKYSFVAYNSFTTVTNAGTNCTGPGSSYIIMINNVLQPPSLASLLAGNMPPIAISVITATVASNPSAAGADGSMILYDGEAASSSSPTDILSSGFTIPLAAIYKGNEFMSFGSATISVAGITVPLQTFNLSGIANADGSISDGVWLGVLHCTDAQCTNLGTTVGGVVSQYIDGNGNMTVLGTFTGSPNTVPYKDWVSAADTASLTLTVGTSTAVLNVTPGTTIASTATLPFVILTQTDANNILSISAYGQGAKQSGTSSPVVINYPLTKPAGATFTPSAGQTFSAYTLFGLSLSPTTPFTLSY